MLTIEINVAEYYNNKEYYASMPEVVFNALEAAYLEGKEIAVVPKAAFEEMINNRVK